MRRRWAINVARHVREAAFRQARRRGTFVPWRGHENDRLLAVHDRAGPGVEISHQRQVQAPGEVGGREFFRVAQVHHLRARAPSPQDLGDRGRTEQKLFVIDRPGLLEHAHRHAAHELLPRHRLEAGVEGFLRADRAAVHPEHVHVAVPRRQEASRLREGQDLVVERAVQHRGQLGRAEPVLGPGAGTADVAAEDRLPGQRDQRAGVARAAIVEQQHDGLQAVARSFEDAQPHAAVLQDVALLHGDEVEVRPAPGAHEDRGPGAFPELEKVRVGALAELGQEQVLDPRAQTPGVLEIDLGRAVRVDDRCGAALAIGEEEGNGGQRRLGIFEKGHARGKMFNFLTHVRRECKQDATAGSGEADSVMVWRVMG